MRTKTTGYCHSFASVIVARLQRRFMHIRNPKRIKLGLGQDSPLWFGLSSGSGLGLGIKFWDSSYETSAYSPGQTRKHCCGNICESRSFLKCFPVCHPWWVAKMFPIKFRNISCFPSVIFVAETLFPSVCPPWETWRNIGRKQCFRNNVS